MESTRNFWNNRYQNQDTGWDVGEITTPLKEYFDQIEDKSLAILIPGSGNSYEAEYLHQNGFNNVCVVDIASNAIDSFKKRVPEFPNAHSIRADFFQLTGRFDLIIEQTFFCAIDKPLRQNYAKQAFKLLKPEGKIVGLFFDAPLNEDRPPYGGDVKEYVGYFDPYFRIEKMEPSYNSISSRTGRELFVKLKKLSSLN